MVVVVVEVPVVEVVEVNVVVAGVVEVAIISSPVDFKSLSQSFFV